MSDHIVAVGMGRMGRGIAITFAYAGYPIALVDLKARSKADFEQLRSKSENEIKSTFSSLAKLGLLEYDEIDEFADRVDFIASADAIEQVREASVIFEGVPEVEETKREVLNWIGTNANSATIVASTTSTILADDLQQYIKCPERFLNAHWLNPAYLVPLVEVSPGSKTSNDVTAAMVGLLEKMGKVPVVCAATPGYIVPRIQALAMNEAARMVEQGVASAEQIDKAIKYGFGFRFAVLGMLEFIDWGGGDILYHASRYLESATGDTRYRAPDIIERNMQEGRLGLVSQSGFLDYTNRDTDAYQHQRLSEFVSMLQQLNKLPVKG